MGNYEVVISNKLKDKLIINQIYYHSINADEYFAVFIKVLNNHVGILKENPNIAVKYSKYVRKYVIKEIKQDIYFKIEEENNRIIILELSNFKERTPFIHY